MFRTLFLTFVAVAACGCQSYQANLDLPDKIERIKVEPINSNNTAYGQLITDHIKLELAKDFTISEEKPDLIITGTATQTTWHHYGEALFILRTESKEVGSISTTQSSLFPDTPKNLAKKVKNILTKNR